MAQTQPTVLSERIAARAVRIYSAIVLIFLISPILVTIPLSFNAGSYFSYPMSGFSLRWYEFVFASPDWQRAFFNSLSIGLVSALMATALGTSAALGLSQPQFPARNLVMSLLVSPMIVRRHHRDGDALFLQLDLDAGGCEPGGPSLDRVP
jgi:putative spermidine/putrescine transport system permease protein